jgi:hypothetical protein
MICLGVAGLEHGEAAHLVSMVLAVLLHHHTQAIADPWA